MPRPRCHRIFTLISVKLLDGNRQKTFDLSLFISTVEVVSLKIWLTATLMSATQSKKIKTESNREMRYVNVRQVATQLQSTWPLMHVMSSIVTCSHIILWTISNKVKSARTFIIILLSIVPFFFISSNTSMPPNSENVLIIEDDANERQVARRLAVEDTHEYLVTLSWSLGKVPGHWAETAMALCYRSWTQQSHNTRPRSLIVSGWAVRLGHGVRHRDSYAGGMHSCVLSGRGLLAGYLCIFVPPPPMSKGSSHVGTRSDVQIFEDHDKIWSRSPTCVLYRILWTLHVGLCVI